MDSSTSDQQKLKMKVRWSSILMSVTIILLCTVQQSHSARIVVIYSVCSKSHMFAVMPVVEELAKRGHEVTVLNTVRFGQK